MPKVISGIEAQIPLSGRGADQYGPSLTLQAVPSSVASFSATDANVSSPMEEIGNLGTLSMHSRSGRLHDGSTRMWKVEISNIPLNLTPILLIEKAEALQRCDTPSLLVTTTWYQASDITLRPTWNKEKAHHTSIICIPSWLLPRPNLQTRQPRV